MRLFWSFARAYPTQSALMILFLLLALLAEGIGLSTLLTLLVVLIGGEDGAEPGRLEAGIRGALEAVGIEVELGNLLLLFVGAMVVQSLLVLVSKRQVGFTVARVAADLRLLLVRSLAMARWSYFTERPAGSLASSITGEAGKAAKSFLSFATVLTISGQALLYASLALVVSWEVTVAAIVAATIAIVSVRRLIQITRRQSRKNTKLMRSLLRHLTDGLHAVKPLKAMARESLLGPLVERDARKIEKTTRRKILANEATRAIQFPMNAAFAAAGIYVAITYWEVPTAELGILVVLFTQTVGKLTRAQRQYQHMTADQEAAYLLRQQIDQALDNREANTGSQPPHLDSAITIEGVHLAYGDLVVLAGTSLEIPAGEVTAIVGPSGAGKTSLADLVTGLVQPDRGTVRIDGVPLAEIDQRAWREGIGYVPQEVFLVNDTVRENVSLGEEMSDEEIEDALRRAGALDFVRDLPKGLRTSVGERGSQLSGGQRQRICIARALVHRPKLLILDEATTALDPQTEARILDSIRALRGQLTVFAISHQPQLMSIADRIYRLEAGKIHLVESVPGPSGGAGPTG